MKRLISALAVFLFMAACSNDPEPAFRTPVITEVTVTAEPTAANISFKVGGGNFSACGINLSEDTEGAKSTRMEATVNEGVATISATGLIPETNYIFTPWAGNDLFETKGPETHFQTLQMPIIRIYDFLLKSIGLTSIKVYFSYTVPDEVILAGCYYSSSNDAAPSRVTFNPTTPGFAAYQIKNLLEDTEYTITPFIVTEQEEITGKSLSARTFSRDVSISDVNVTLLENNPHVVTFSFNCVCPTWANAYLWIQQGKTVTYDENTLFLKSNQEVRTTIPASINWYFALSDTEYTIVPAIVPANESTYYNGSPVTFRTSKHDDQSVCYLIWARKPMSFELPNREWNDIDDMEDPVFRSYLLDNFDLDKDGTLSCDEANMVRSIDCNNMNINSFLGLERFQNLEELNTSGNQASVNLEFKFWPRKYIRDDYSTHAPVCLSMPFLKQHIK